MKTHLIAAVLLSAMFAARQVHASSLPCPGDTTVQIDECLKSKLDHAEAELGRYTTAATSRIGKGDNPSLALASFDAARKSWAAYRTAECGAVYAFYSGGTIRGAMSLTCARRLTLSRTHEIWGTWLTFMDSTPPVLPEPSVEPDR